MAGNAYSPINPYKQGLCRWHPINLYEFYTKTFKKNYGEETEKRPWKEKEDTSFFPRSYN